jgi:hypothetical protein
MSTNDGGPRRRARHVARRFAQRFGFTKEFGGRDDESGHRGKEEE